MPRLLIAAVVSLLVGCSGGTSGVLDAGNAMDAGNGVDGGGDVTAFTVSVASGRPNTVGAMVQVITGTDIQVVDEPVSTDPWLANMTSRVITATKTIGGQTATSNFELKINGNVITLICHATSTDSGSSAKCGFEGFRIELVNPGAKSLKIHVGCSASVTTNDVAGVQVGPHPNPDNKPDYCNKSLPIVPPNGATGQNNLAGATVTADPTAPSPGDPLFVELHAVAVAINGTADATITFTVDVTK